MTCSTPPERLPPVRQESFRQTLEYCAGKRSAADLLQAVQGSRGALCNAHLCIALTALSDGDRPLARKHMQLCVATHMYDYTPWPVGRMLLPRLERESAWPFWIPAKVGRMGP